MPQVSVIPAKIRPAPTKADSPMNAGWTNQPSTAPSSTSDPAAMRTCRSSEMAFLPRTTGRPASTQAIVPPSTLTTFEKPALRNFSHACWPRLPERQMTYSGSLAEPLRACINAAAIELIQWDVACDLDVDLPILDGRAHVDEVDLLAFLAEFGKFLWVEMLVVLMIFSSVESWLARIADMHICPDITIYCRKKTHSLLPPNRASMQVMMFARWVSTIW